jgi:hypothetical protein
MNRIFICLLTVAVIVSSCGKSVKPPVHYSVTNDVNDSAVEDIFIPDNGNYTMSVKVKFLEGYQGQDDKVQLTLAGLPANVTVSPNTFTGIPTYTEAFTFTSTGAPQGVYGATITSSTNVGLPQVYYFNIHVIPADCAALFWGNITGSSACTSRQYAHSAVGSTGGTNVLMVSNFGGYGNHCNVQVVLNCNNDSLHIAKADYGNGVTLQGSGIFNADSMIINYTAFSTPTGGTESCTLTYKNH